MAEFTCPKTFDKYQLPPNLALHQRKIEGKWRYNGPDGRRDICHYSKRDQKYIDVRTAIDWALQLNKKYHDIEPSEHYLLPIGAVSNKKTLLNTAEEFIGFYEANNKTKADKAYWQNQKRDLKRFCEDFKDVSINVESLEQWFYGIGEFEKLGHSYHFQKRNRPILTKFINYLIRKEQAPNLTVNPFTSGGAGCFESVEAPVKLRTPLYKEDYDLMLQKAIEADDHAFVSALKLDLASGLRINDLVNLRLDNWNQDTNIVRLTISKSASQRGEAKAAKLAWDLSSNHNLDILNYFKQAWLTRDSVKTLSGQYSSPAEHVIHARPRIVRESKTKEHYAQVSARYLQDKFAYYRDFVPRIQALSTEEKPTFHEIRALFVLQRHLEGWSQEMISSVLGHADLRVMLERYGQQVDDYRTTVIDDKFIKTARKEANNA